MVTEIKCPSKNRGYCSRVVPEKSLRAEAQQLSFLVGFKIQGLWFILGFKIRLSFQVNFKL